MLSPTGLCRAFSTDADGYVRAEGGAVLILRRAATAISDKNRVHGIIKASEVNSDGRTNGISLPSAEGQERLIRRVYDRSGISAKSLAFVEAHGTGTAAGDPIEALALGRALGQKRSDPLPIGSLKTNLGHLEAASGLAGLIKATLALQNGVLPASLHFSSPNPNIDFDALNLKVCHRPLTFNRSHLACAGVSSFGFGGTNAHVIVAAGPEQFATQLSTRPDGYLSISAKTKPALVGLAAKYLDRTSTLSDRDTALVATAAAHRRDPMTERLVVTSTRQQDVADALKAFVEGGDHELLTTGQAQMPDMPVAFVYSGNGSQWPGMGRSAYLKSAPFRRRFDEIDAIFGQLAGWSLRDAIFDANLGERLDLTSVAQPLIFAIQSAATYALCSRGLYPAVVLGHSVGEAAAAEAAGILDLRSAVHLVYCRSKHQETVRNAGRMIAVVSTCEAVQKLVAEVSGIEIAAYNAPRALTVSGSAGSVARFIKLAKQRRIACVDLDLDYPFHTSLMDSVQSALIKELDGLKPKQGNIPFVSTVEGASIPGANVDAIYWWKNIRNPVRFADAVCAAADLGARLFVEIGPRELLTRHIKGSVTAEPGTIKTFSVLSRSESPGSNPIDKAVANSIVCGAKIDIAEVTGADPGSAVPLPIYPWQQERLRYSPSQEAIGWFQTERHRLAGDRYSPDTLEWHSQIDTVQFPELLDHRLGERVILPGTAFLEMALFAASQWLESEPVTLADFETLTPLELNNAQSHEVMTRISHVSRTFEILSRPRLSQASWTLHARGRILHGTGADGGSRPDVGTDVAPTTGEMLYQIADRSGLHYGPAFSSVKRATLYQNDVIDVELAPAIEPTEYLLDFMKLDCCAQGLIVLFSQLQACERGVAYIPVRLDEVNLLRPGLIPSRALIEVIDKNERAILANLTILSADDAVIAILRGVRCQATSVRRPQGLESVALVETLEMASGRVGGTARGSFSLEDMVSRTPAAGLASAATPDLLSERSRLLEAWATLAGYEIVAALSSEGRFSLDPYIAHNRIPGEFRPFFENLLLRLRAAELVSEHQDSWVLCGDASLPSSYALIAELAEKFPERAAELLIAAEISRIAEQLTTQKNADSKIALQVSRAAFDFYDSATCSATQLTAGLTKLLRETLALWPETRAIRVLQIGAGPLLDGMLEKTGRQLDLTVLEPDGRRMERTKLSNTGEAFRLIDRLDDASYDLIVSADALHRLPASVEPATLRESLTSDGAFLAIVRQDSLFRDLVFGLRPASDVDAESEPYSPRSPAAWAAVFETVSVTHPNCDGDAVTLIAGKVDAATGEHEPPTLPIVKILAGRCPDSMILANALARRLRSRGHQCHPTMVAFSEVSDVQESINVHFVSHDKNVGNAEALAQACLEIKTIAERFDSKPMVLWLIFKGALAGGNSRVDPVQTGAWAFARTLANELPNLRVRKIDIKQGIATEIAAVQICAAIESNTQETEYFIDETAVRVVRVSAIGQIPKQDRDIVAAARLERRQSIGQRIAWHPAKRRHPEADEVEIAVGATGLNFRDVMYSLGILSDDLFDNGVCGPALGLECAGRVVAAGTDVRGLQVGDRVIALASNAFSTHVTVSSVLTAKIPEGMSIESAATIPVAFITAYYSLGTLARLAPAEWVLIHGGAGAVGMAAIQIARSRGGKVIATAGTEAKRALLRTLGVAHVLDSRSTKFVDDVRKITGAGVNVVLNSLAGEAMERSIECLRPFGRFIELGKRDFAAATYIGLRPFRKNLSYFGVDVDQLAASQPGALREVFDAVMKGFADGSFALLPHSVFEAAALTDAFRLLQQSTHVGKIVIHAPDLSTIRHQVPAFTVDRERTHLITGGLSGFGLAAAEWLADRGARYLALVSRRGVTTNEAREALSRLSQRGIKVFAKACDVSDPEQVEILLEGINRAMPPLAGVIHSAMVLDDTIVENLNAERFKRVLAPKVTGADNLDRATRGLPLDYFVLFSSVVTLIGNRGQGSYVAANAYLEGLARHRRQAGLPALAIGWGPIVDVGVVARTERMRTDVHKMGGLRGMKASEALDLMALAISESGSDARLAVMTIAPHEGAFSADLLPALKSPAYRNLASQSRESIDGERIDLRELFATEDMELAREKIIQLITTQVARVLLFRKEDISTGRSLSEMGLDSLMAVELALNLEECFGLHLSLKGSAGALTVTSLADEIIALANLKEPSTNEGIIVEFVGQHVKEVGPEDLELMREILND